MFRAILFVLPILWISDVACRKLASVRLYRNNEEFGILSTVRLQNIKGIDIQNCAGIRIAFDYVLTTRACYENKNLGFVQFEEVKTYISSHGHEQGTAVAATYSEQGRTKLKTRQFKIHRIHDTRDSALIGLKLEREFPSRTKDLENLKQAPIFLDTVPITEKESLMAYGWHWKGNNKKSSKRNRVRLGGIVQVSGCYRQRVSLCTTCPDTDDEKVFYVNKVLSPGTPIMRIHDGMPILVGLTTTSDLEGVTAVLSITKNMQQISTIAPMSMWFDANADYTTYIKGANGNKAYQKWWSVKYDEATRIAREKRENDLLYSKTYDDPNARAITGTGYILEALDAKHRYGSCLKGYHIIWKELVAEGKADPDISFFEWFDFGEGRAVNVRGRCNRTHIERMKIQFCDAADREQYEIQFEPVTVKGITQLKLTYKQTGEPVYARGQNIMDKYLNSKYIFVWDLSKRFYVHKKVTGQFQHSSFTAGEPVYAAGAISTTREGYLRILSPHSGHYSK